MCNGDNEADAMEQDWKLHQEKQMRDFQDAFEYFLMEQMRLKSYEITANVEENPCQT